MSKYIDEIINDLKKNPETYRDNAGQGVRKGDVEVIGYGNSAVLSTISVMLNGHRVPSSYRDNFRLEVAIKRWYRTSPLTALLNK